MAAALLRQMLGGSLNVGSAGVRKGELDPFAVAGHGGDRHRHRGAPADHLRGARGLGRARFRPDRHARARGAPQGARTHPHRLAAEVEYWPTADPTAIEGNREQRLDAYRAVRDQLMARIRARFAA